MNTAEFDLRATLYKDPQEFKDLLPEDLYTVWHTYYRIPLATIREALRRYEEYSPRDRMLNYAAHLISYRANQWIDLVQDTLCGRRSAAQVLALIHTDAPRRAHEAYALPHARGVGAVHYFCSRHPAMPLPNYLGFLPDDVVYLATYGSISQDVDARRFLLESVSTICSGHENATTRAVRVGLLPMPVHLRQKASPHDYTRVMDTAAREMHVTLRARGLNDLAILSAYTGHPL